MNKDEHNTFNLKQALDNLFQKDKKLSRNLTEQQIKRIWYEMMDNTLAPYTTRVKFKDGTLKVWLNSSSMRDELNRGKKMIIKNMNDKIGEERIKKLILL